AEIIRPKTEDISTDALMAMFGLGGDVDDPNNLLSGAMGGQAGALASGGGQMLAGAMQTQLQTMMTQLGELLREVRVTVYWPDGKQMEHFTVVTHVVSLGPGTDQLQTQSANQPTLQQNLMNPNPGGLNNAVTVPGLRNGSLNLFQGASRGSGPRGVR